MTIIDVLQGDSPVVLAMPHTGIEVPDSIFKRLNERGQRLADTDWHIDKLYAGLLDRASTVRTTIHRYVIDANRDPAGTSLYPGQNTTGLCPLVDFDGQPIYRDNCEPDAAEIERRRVAYHAPYHAALGAELERVRQRHGFALLYDCHSIRSQAPFLFPGTLPDFNIGTNDGASCDPAIAEAVAATCKDAVGLSHVLNGRFKGGWTTRHYGQPDTGVHAIQMELAQASYMDEAAPWPWRNEQAAPLRAHLKTILETLHQSVPAGPAIK
jgi:formiminoglutamase